MPARFSICIPTYNRAAFIGTTLKHLLPEVADDMEVVIVDGCSTDDTPSLVADMQKRCPAIRYFRREENVGVDADILKAVELAEGEYCWLLSDDDCIQPRAVAHVRAKLAEYPGVAGASLNYLAYDTSLKYRVREVPAASGGRIRQDHLFLGADEAFSVLGIHFGYLSAQVVNRKLWNEVVVAEDLTPYLNSWLMVYIIGKMVRKCPNWLYLHRRCVGYRTGNDSFTERLGAYRRQVITHVAYAQIIAGLFGARTTTYRAVFNTLIKDRMARSLAVLKAGGASYHLQLQLFTLYARQYWNYPQYWLRVLPVFLVPNRIAELARVLYLWWRSRAATHQVAFVADTPHDVSA